MPAEVFKMADHRTLINPSASIYFAFDDVMTEEELNRRIRILTDTVYSLGGHMDDDRGECVELEATDQGTGSTWEGGGDESKYARRTGSAKADKKLTLEDILQYFEPHDMGDYIAHYNRPEMAVINSSDVYVGHPFEITQIHTTKKGRVLAVFYYDKEVSMKKKDFETGEIEIMQRIRPHP